MKHPVKILLISFLVFLSLLAGLVTFFSISPGENLIRIEIEKRAGKALSKIVHIERLEANLFNRISIGKIEILNLDSSRFVSLEEGTTRYSLLSFLTKSPTIELIKLDGLDASIFRDSLGTFNLPQVSSGKDKSTQASGKKLKIILKQLEINNSSVSYADDMSEIDSRLTNLQLELTRTNDDLIYIHLKADSLRFSIQSKPVVCDNLELSASLEDTLLIVDYLSFQPAGLSVTGNGKINIKDRDLKFASDLAISGSTVEAGKLIRNFVPSMTIPETGEFSLKLKAEGGIENPSAEITIYARDISTGGYTLPEITGQLGWKRTGIQDDLSVDLNWRMILPSGKAITPNSLSAGAVLNDSFLVLSDVKLKSGRSEASGRLKINVSDKNHPIIGLFSASVSAPDINNFLSADKLSKIPSINGKIQTVTHLAGSLTNPSIRSRIDIPRLSTEAIVFEEFSAWVKYENMRFQIDSLSSRINDGSFTGEGFIDLKQPHRYRIRLNLDDVELASTLSSFFKDTSAYQGNFQGELTSDGCLDSLETIDLKCRLNFQNINYAGKPLPDFLAELRYQSSQLGLYIQQSETRINADLTLSNKSINGRFTVAIPEIEHLADLANIKDFNGTFDLHGNIRGSINAPSLSANFSGNGLNYRGLPLDSLSGIINYNDHKLAFVDCIGSGRMPDISSVSREFELADLSGELVYLLKFSGSPDNPSGEAHLSLANLVYKENKIENIEADIALASNTVRLNYFKFQNNNEILYGSGECGLKTYSGSVELNQQAIAADSLSSHSPGKIITWFNLNPNSIRTINATCNNFNIEKFLIFAPLSGDIRGILNFNLETKGTISNPVIHLTANVVKPGYRNSEIDSILAEIFIDSKALNLSRLSVFKGKKIAAGQAKLQLNRDKSGKITLTGSDKFTGAMNADNIDLAFLNPLIAKNANIKGICTCNMKWNGTISDPNLRGSIKFVDGELMTNPDAESFTNIRVFIEMSDTVLVLHDLHTDYRNIPIDGKGRLKFLSKNSLESQVSISLAGQQSFTSSGTISKDSIDIFGETTDLDLSIMEPFLPHGTILGGRILSKLKFSGLIHSPYIEGKAVFNDVMYSSDTTLFKITDGELYLIFDGNRITADSISGRINKGEFRAHGGFEYKDHKIRNYQAALSANQVRFEEPEKYTLTIKTAQLNLIQEGDFNLIDGEISLGETRIINRFQPEKILSYFQNLEKPRPDLPAFITSTKLQIRIKDSDNIWIDNNLARMRLHSELSFIGNAANPLLTGRLSVSEGYITYLDRKFDIGHGSLDFFDPNRLNPYVDVSATTSVKNYQSLEATPYLITLSLQGEIDHVRTDLTSEPPESKSDILALLTLGMTRNQLRGGDGSQSDATVSGIMRERVELMSSRRISGFISGKVGTALGLEEMTIENNLFNFKDSSGPQLIASKKISNRLGITYTTSVGHINDQGIKLDYMLTNHFAVEGQTDQRGRSGIDLKYRLRLR